MDYQEFTEQITAGSRDEYVDDKLLAFLAEDADFRVVNKSALEKESINQTEFLSVALPHSGSELSDGELIEAVTEKMKVGAQDVQKYQLRVDGEVPEVVEIWRHGSGYSAFVQAE